MSTGDNKKIKKSIRLTVYFYDLFKGFECINLKCIYNLKRLYNSSPEILKDK